LETNTNNPSKALKIVFLSDLNWSSHLRSITLEEVNDFNLEKLSVARYQRINRYWNIITEEKADLVLFAGDLTGDGSCGHGFQNAFKILLKLLEDHKITSRFIAGNHDELELYEEVISFAKDFKYTADLSNKTEEVLGLKIAGIDFYATESMSRLNTVVKQLNGSYDILLAHSELKRRIRLLELDAKYICTGHYDRKLFMHREKVFISLDNDWEEVSYATLLLESDPVISFKVKQSKIALFNLEQRWSQLLSNEPNHVLTVNGNPAIDLKTLETYPDNSLVDDSGESLLFLKYLRGTNYSNAMNTMMKTKDKIELEETDLPFSDLFGFPIAAKYRMSRKLIFDYVPLRKKKGED
jgi:3',5'-cyclic AMP phosphodiesterase CpdA